MSLQSSHQNPIPLESTEEAEMEQISLTPGRLAWRQLRRNRVALLGGFVLCLLYAAAIFANFLSPYPVSELRSPLHPPTPLVWHDAAGHFSLLPYVVATRSDPEPGTFKYLTDETHRTPVRLFVKGYDYRLIGIVPLSIHLFGTDERAPIFLLGTDKLRARCLQSAADRSTDFAYGRPGRHRYHAHHRAVCGRYGRLLWRSR